MIRPAPSRGADPSGDSRGSSYVEVLVASALLAVGLLGLCGMFTVGYSNVATAGKSTMAVAAGRQLFEDLQLIPYDQLATLDGFDTDNAGSAPASGAPREVARRWRYALAGEGVGWTFSGAELERWNDLAAQGDDLRATGVIDVVPRSATLSEISIRLRVPGSWRELALTTLVARP